MRVSSCERLAEKRQAGQPSGPPLLAVTLHGLLPSALIGVRLRVNLLGGNDAYSGCGRTRSLALLGGSLEGAWIYWICVGVCPCGTASSSPSSGRVTRPVIQGQWREMEADGWMECDCYLGAQHLNHYHVWLAPSTQSCAPGHWRARGGWPACLFVLGLPSPRLRVGMLLSILSSLLLVKSVHPLLGDSQFAKTLKRKKVEVDHQPLSPLDQSV